MPGWAALTWVADQHQVLSSPFALSGQSFTQAGKMGGKDRRILPEKARRGMLPRLTLPRPVTGTRSTKVHATLSSHAFLPQFLLTQCSGIPHMGRKQVVGTGWISSGEPSTWLCSSHCGPRT